MAKKRKKRAKARTRTVKTKLAGYTKVKKQFALVFSKGKKKYLGKSRYKSKAGLAKAARKYMK